MKSEDRNGSVALMIALIVVVALIGGGIWYYKAHKDSATQPSASATQVTSTYQSADYGVSFEYPSNWTFKPGDTGEGDYGLYTPYGPYQNASSTVSLVTVEIPPSFYPGTNLEGAYFNLSINRQLTQSQCLGLTSQPGPNNGGGVTAIGGVTFNWTRAGSVAAGTDEFSENYSGYTNDTCYEFNLGDTTGNDVSPAGTRMSSSANDISVLEGVFSSVKFTSSQTDQNGADSSTKLEVLSPHSGDVWSKGDSTKIVQWKYPRAMEGTEVSIYITLRNPNDLDVRDAIAEYDARFTVPTNSDVGELNWDVFKNYHATGNVVINIAISDDTLNPTHDPSKDFSATSDPFILSSSSVTSAPIVPIVITSPASGATYPIEQVMNITWRGYTHDTDICELWLVGPIDSTGQVIQSLGANIPLRGLPCKDRSFSWNVSSSYIHPGYNYKLGLTTPYNQNAASEPIISIVSAAATSAIPPVAVSPATGASSNIAQGGIDTSSWQTESIHFEPSSICWTIKYPPTLFPMGANNGFSSNEEFVSSETLTPPVTGVTLAAAFNETYSSVASGQAFTTDSGLNGSIATNSVGSWRIFVQASENGKDFVLVLNPYSGGGTVPYDLNIAKAMARSITLSCDLPASPQ